MTPLLCPTSWYISFESPSTAGSRARLEIWSTSRAISRTGRFLHFQPHRADHLDARNSVHLTKTSAQRCGENKTPRGDGLRSGDKQVRIEGDFHPFRQRLIAGARTRLPRRPPKPATTSTPPPFPKSCEGLESDYRRPATLPPGGGAPAVDATLGRATKSAWGKAESPPPPPAQSRRKTKVPRG